MAFEGVPEGETATTCPYCGVGCGVLVKPAADSLSADVRGDPGHPSNHGGLCSKGSALGETLAHEERLLFPEIDGKRVNWSDAIARIASGFSDAIDTHGPDSVAFYVSGQILTEDYYVANKLMKGFIGSANIDTNSRLCMASSVVGHKRAFGTDTVPGCYEDLDEADLIVMVGSNFAWCHPVLHQRILTAQARRGTKIVVIDPRCTATTEAADLHLQIKPGGDVALFNWLFWHLAQSPAFDADFVGRHTTHLSEALSAAYDIGDDEVSDQTDLSMANLERFLSLVQSTARTVTIYSQGVNQSAQGSDKVNAILNTHLVTGRIGKPGAGPFSITGQPNAMGGREVGGLANQLAAHMDFTPADIDRVRRYWRAPAMPSRPGLKAVDMFNAVADGRIKAIWIMATNPVVSLPDSNKVRAALAECPLVVVSDVVSTSDTVQLADVKLPATGWGEKTGTVTNSERRISRQRSFLRPPGEARHDWQALCDVAQVMGYSGFGFDGPAAIYREHARLSGFENNDTRAFDINAHADLSDEAYDKLSPFQWPVPGRRDRPGAEDAGAHRFFADGRFYTPDQKARFVATTAQRAPARTSSEFPLILNTGRIRDHWHTMTRTGKTARLSAHVAEPFVELCQEDATNLNLNPADLARVRSNLGEVILRVQVSDRQRLGEVFAPIHWSDRYASKARIDTLVASRTDPFSGQPDSKFTPVKISRFDADWFGLGIFRDEPSRTMLEGATYWAIVRIEGGWRVEVAGEDSGLQRISDLLDQDDCVSLTMSDGAIRRATFRDGDLNSTLILSRNGPVEADRAWLAAQLLKPHDTAARFSLLAGRASDGEDAGRIICSCLGVGVSALTKAAMAGARSVEGLGDATGAGTNCGSCKPELRQLLAKIDVERAANQKVTAE